MRQCRVRRRDEATVGYELVRCAPLPVTGGREAAPTSPELEIRFFDARGQTSTIVPTSFYPGTRESQIVEESPGPCGSLDQEKPPMDADNTLLASE